MDGKASVKEYYKAQSDHRAVRLEQSGLNLHRDVYFEHSRLFRSLIEPGSPYDRGLDIGAGPGVWAEFLAGFCHEVLGVDFVEENVANATIAAERKGLANKVRYRIDDAESLESVPSESVDLATQVSVLQHLPNQRKALEAAHSVLKPGGSFLLLVQNKKCIRNFNKRRPCADTRTIGINEYSELKELKSLLESIGFEVEAVRACWLFVRDLLYIGTEHRFLRFFNPVRRPLMVLFESIERGLNRRPSLNPLFRELVFLARKKGLQQDESQRDINRD
jgi:ubiquinone/menaquinone biosynthesis C-methylase UbiE